MIILNYIYTLALTNLMKKLFFSLFLAPFFLLSQKKEIAFKSYTLHPIACSGFQTSSGSFIFVPPGAFQTESGDACQGKIVLKYREFHSQTDMYYSGLNMVYEAGGKYRILESIGMFEIQAWCGDKKLNLKEGKSIQVRMKTRRNLDSLWSFVYDAKKNTWSKYISPVIDFSYRKNNNKADSSAIWGNPAVPVQSAGQIEDIEGGTVTITSYAAKLPEGFFKGMNIKEMGIFNYDGVIKDSLAVPMIPEFIVKTENIPLQQKVYVAYESKNTLVYYYPDDLKERFVLLKVKGTRIFTEFKDGSMACTAAGEMDKTDLETFRNKTINIALEKQPVKPKSEKELAAITGLKTN